MSSILFVLKILIDFYLYILLLRLFLQKYRAPFHNPICRFVVRITEPLVKPLQRFIPGYKGFDLAIIAILAVLQTLFYFLVIVISAKVSPNIFGLLLISAGALLVKWFNLIFYAIIIHVLISWFSALQNSAIAPIAQLLAEPWLRLGRRFIPTLGGFDFTPVVILLFIKLVSMLIFYPIINLGLKIAL